jgi:hypothetical protein
MAEIRGASPFVLIRLKAPIAPIAVCRAEVSRMSPVNSGMALAALVPRILKAY